MIKNKGFSPVIIVVLIAIVGALVIYVLTEKNINQPIEDTQLETKTSSPVSDVANPDTILQELEQTNIDDFEVELEQMEVEAGTL